LRILFAQNENRPIDRNFRISLERFKTELRTVSNYDLESLLTGSIQPTCCRNRIDPSLLCSITNMQLLIANGAREQINFGQWGIKNEYGKDAEFAAFECGFELDQRNL
jgi:hypothetical protein